MKIAQKTANRLKNILKQDKEKISSPFINMIKSDLYEILSSYFEVFPKDINLDYFIDEDGLYNFNINIRSNKIKKVSFLLK